MKILQQQKYLEQEPRSEEAEDEEDSGEADDVGDEEERSVESPEIKDEGDVDEEDGPEESPEIKDEADLSDDIEQEDEESSQQQRDSQLVQHDWQVWEDQTMVGRSDEGFNYTAIRLQLPTCTTEECKARHAVLKKMRIPWSDLDMKLLADVVKSRIPQPKGPRNPAWGGRLLPFSSAVPQAHVRRNGNLFDRQRLGGGRRMDDFGI
ncbi:hypothetical protein ABVK25_000638 [Lepraria finkii]|uniref:Uncharacterized protein n=1 Tax=Lepraria finkii TaxID=1340010 RepID=A0ABR4BQD7_9LECA